MEPFTKLHHQLMQQLSADAIEADNMLVKADRSFRTAQHYCAQVNGILKDFSFRDLASEIHFFKNIQPLFLKELFYFSKLYALESDKPVGSRERQKAYYNVQLDRQSNLIDQHRSIYQYYRSGRSDCDHQFFVRGAKEASFSPELTLYMDGQCASVYSLKVSELLAAEELCDHITAKLEMVQAAGIDAGESQSPLVWTDSNASLVELIYALHARGAINHGKLDMKQIIQRIELLFNVKLGNFYQVIKSIRTRKDRTAFLNNLITSAIKRMDDTDMDF